MKALIYTGLFLFVFPLLVQAQPSIVFTEENAKVGQIQQGQEATYTFEFVNKGTDELVIKRVSTS